MRAHDFGFGLTVLALSFINNLQHCVTISAWYANAMLYSREQIVHLQKRCSHLLKISRGSRSNDNVQWHLR